MYLLFLKRKIGFIELQKLLGLTPGNLDHHVRKLEEVGLIRSHRVISWRPLLNIEITSDGVSTFRTYIIKMKALLKEIPDKMLLEPDERVEE